MINGTSGDATIGSWLQAIAPGDGTANVRGIRGFSEAGLIERGRRNSRVRLFVTIPLKVIRGDPRPEVKSGRSGGPDCRGVTVMESTKRGVSASWCSCC